MGSTSKTVDGVLALESSTRRALLASSSKESAPGNEVAWLSHASSGGSSNTSMSSGRSDGLLDAEERGRALKAAGIVGVAMRGLGGNESSSSISNACTSVSTTGMWADEIQQARARVCSLVETTLNLEGKHTLTRPKPWKSNHDSPAQKPRAVRHLYRTVPVASKTGYNVPGTR
jgi:hypothetical protein